MLSSGSVSYSYNEQRKYCQVSLFLLNFEEDKKHDYSSTLHLGLYSSVTEIVPFLNTFLFALFQCLSQCFSLTPCYVFSITSSNISPFQDWLFRCKCLRFRIKKKKKTPPIFILIQLLELLNRLSY